MRSIRHSLALGATVALAVAGASCSSATDPASRDPGAVRRAAGLRVRDCEGPATSLAASLAAGLAPRQGLMVPDDRWADLAATVPGGFAGVFYDEGRPVLMLTRPDEAAAAKAALAPRLGSGGFDVAGAEVRQARWDFAQLHDWFAYLNTQATVWDRANKVTIADTDEVANRIVIGAADAAARDRLAATLTSLGLPCDLVVVKIQAPAVSLQNQ